MDNNRLRRTIQGQLKKKKTLTNTFNGTIGKNDGTVHVPNREGYVYVLIGSELQEVYNARIEPQYGTPVIIGVDSSEPNKQQILTVNEPEAKASNASLSNAGYAPSKRYRMFATGGGEDPLYVELRQFMPLRVSTLTGLLVSIYPGPILLGATWLYRAFEVVDLTSYVPSTAGKALLALLTIDTAGASAVTVGSELDINTILDLTSAPVMPVDTLFALALIRLYNTQTTIQETSNNSDIFDLRTSCVPVLSPALVGLGNVINEKQLTIAANDWNQFSTKATPIGTDVLLGEDSADGFKKKRMLISSISTGGGSSGGGIGSASMNWFVDGLLGTGIAIGGSYLVTGDGQIRATYSLVEDGGTSGTTIVDINLNGVTVFTNQGYRLMMDAASGIVQDAKTPEVIDVVIGDVISMDIDAVAVGATSLSVSLAFDIPAAPVAGGAGHTIQKDGVPMTPRLNLNFTGIQVTDVPTADAIEISLSPDVLSPPSLRVWSNTNFI